MTIYKQASNEKYILKVFYDEDPINPREWDNLGTMVFFHKRYDLGDPHNLKSTHFDSMDDVKEHLIEVEDAEIIRSVYIYDHSGVALSMKPFSSYWDSGKIGFIYATEEQIKNWYEVDEITDSIYDKVVEMFKSEINVYNEYLNGRVFYYVLNDKETDEIIDSCHGFYQWDIDDDTESLKMHINEKDARELVNKLEEV